MSPKVLETMGGSSQDMLTRTSDGALSHPELIITNGLVMECTYVN